MAYTTIDDPSAYFHTQLFTGTGSELSVTNDANAGDFKPDWIWIKQRNASTNHGLFDSSRGVTKNLKSDSTDAESTEAQSVKTFNTDGFTLGTSGDYNGSSDTHVAWQWIANGGTTTTNDASATSVGSLDSVYQANTTAGFSIVTYTGAGGNQTIAHGLGAVPNVIFIRRRDGGGDWTSYHSDLGAEKFMRLNSINAKGDQATYFNDTSPTSTVFTVGNAGDVNTSTGTHVAYCFAEKQGYSKFGTYTGNGNSDGPFIYTGFKPAWIMVKSSSMSNSETNWVIWDNKRNGYNVNNVQIFPNQSWAEGQRDDNGGANVADLDILSNGFKQRESTWAQNGQNGAVFIYMAFAESPFVSSKGVPTTAR